MALNNILRQIPQLNLEELETLSHVVESFILVEKAKSTKISRLDISLDELIAQEKSEKVSPRSAGDYPGDSVPGCTTREELDQELDQIHKSLCY